MRELVAVLINYVDECSIENLMLKEKLSLCENHNTSLLAQVSEMSARIRILESNNKIVEEDPSISEND